jgi:hypothetical protein
MHKFGNNKFDMVNMHIPKMTVYDPFMMQEYNQPGFVPPQQNYYQPKPVPIIREDAEVLDFLGNFFSVENLNQDLYLRNRIDENGFVKVDEIANFNAMKQNDIAASRILEVANSSQFLEVVTKEGINYVRNKNWDNVKGSLLTKEQISANKRLMKRNEKLAMNNMNMYGQQMGMNSMVPTMMPMNYVNMQNNYFFQTSPGQPSQAFGGFPTPQMYMGFNMPQAEEK